MGEPLAVAEVFLALEVLGVIVLAGGLTAILRRPRLRLEASLRGGTRDGTLYVVVTHARGWAAPRARLEVWWQRNGERSEPLRQELGTLHVGDALRLEVDGLHRVLPPGEGSWDEIVVRLWAWNALPAWERLVLTKRSGSVSGTRAEGPSAPVRYARGRELPCPERPDGTHDFEERPYVNDGVTERWRVCRACRHVVREPLTPEQEETQRRARSARAQRLRRLMEEEFARLDAEAQAQRRQHARRAPPPSQGDEYPLELAFFVLELDATRATWADVSAAHRRLALAHHPDRHANASPDARAAAEQKMQEINRARDRLREHYADKAA